MSETHLTREEHETNARRKSDLADLKQHADKLILGFENSSSNDAKRALWELIQNARDLSKEAAVEVLLEPKQFSFTHHGNTFDSNTLLCLVKQVSSKTRKKKEEKANEDEVKEVGQYGTGFISTHSLGKRFYVDGTIELQPGEFVVLNDFLIDRIAGDPEILSTKLFEQQKEIFRLIREGILIDHPSPTTFRYQFDHPIEVANADIALSENTESLIPFVMALNANLKSVTITKRKEGPELTTIYRKTGNDKLGDLSVIFVQQDSKPIQNIYILSVDQELDLKIILPLSDPLNAINLQSGMSRLFLYFPLIGTENWGSNFIIHCGLFNPHEKRDGIWISSDNPQNKEKEIDNQKILAFASQAIFNFLKAHAKSINNSIHLANISFPTASGNEFLDTYFRELKSKWVTQFKTYQIVDSTDDRKEPSSCFFLSEELMDDSEFKDSNFDLVALFWKPLPVKILSEEWTTIIRKWEDPATQWITIIDICKKIEGSPVGSIDTSILQSFYSYLLKTGGHRYFDDFRLLPTFNKTFSKKTGLYKSTPLHELFIEVAQVFAPKVKEQLVQDSFIQEHNFEDYTRTELSKQLNPSFREISAKLKADYMLTDIGRPLLIKFCNSYPSLDNRGARGELMNAILKFYEQKLEPLEIPNLGEDKIDYAIAVECLIKNTVFEFARKEAKDKEWVKNNLKIIKDFLGVLSRYKDYSDILTNLPVFVNKNCTLIPREKALIQKDIPEDLKTLYFSIFKKDVNDELLDDDFVPFYKDGKTLEGGQLALDIIKFINEHGPIEAINTHPDSRIIMEIIRKISDKDSKKADLWSKLFQGISAAKATIVMARVTKEEMKENLFSIINLEDDNKIALLGELARSESMEDIIELGRQALLEKQTRQFDFDLKHELGKHIEDLLRKEVDASLQSAPLNVEVKDEQKGKDIVILSGTKVLYYLEVKSRWRSDYSIRMSKLQAETAVGNPDSYSLVGINMVDYYPAEGNRYAPQNIALIKDKVAVLEKIGTTITPLIENAMKRNREDQDIHLAPDYSVVVPQPVFAEEGIDLDTFMNNLVNIIKTRLATEIKVK